MNLLFVFLVSFALSYLFIRFPYHGLQDSPNERSLHNNPIPRSGGIGVLLALLLGIMLEPGHKDLFLLAVWCAFFLLCFASLWDDFISLPPLLRLVVQCVVAVIVVFIGEVFLVSEWGRFSTLVLLCFQLLSVLAIVWGINLYNFMDGMDGFAAGMAFVGFSSMGLLGFWQHDTAFAYLNACIVMAVLGFTCWNSPPAKIFLGDMGSTALGFFMVVLSLYGQQVGLFPFWVPLVLFAPFWVDASYTLIRRVISGEKFWLPHRQHLYQRLVLSGKSHKTVVSWEYGFMGLGAISVLLPFYYGLGYNGAVPLAFLLGYVLLMTVLRKV